MGDDTIIELAEGKIFLLENTADGEERPITIITPAGTASPRGTWLSVQYNSKKGVTEVQCFRGVCELENEFGKQIMTDEEKSESTGFAAPSRPVVMDENELIEFAGLPEAQSGEIAIPSVQVVPIRTVLADIPAESLAVEAEAIPAPLPKVVASLPSPKPAAGYVPTPVAKPTPTPPPATLEPVVQVEPVIVAAPTPTSEPAPVPVALPEVVNNTLPQALLVTATINGASAPDGTLVSVWMKAYREPLAQGQLADGKFLLVVPQYGSTPFLGGTMTFRIGELNAGETAIWQPGAADILGLTAVE